jgi:glycine/D-amino acid oxidase-like deaminating enzyme
MSNYSSRRDFLRGAMATSAVLLAARSRAFGLQQQRPYPLVKVSRQRLIREVVGLRPYRAGGFVVQAERFGQKLLIHNYGHGGAGITLSWGTASLALDLAKDFVSSRGRRSLQFAVVGCGVNGLSTARLLQRRFPGPVTIYAKELPPDTTSNIAGGFWHPTSVYAEGETNATFNSQFREACQLSNRMFQLLVGRDYGVRWIDTLDLIRNESSLSRDLPGGSALYPQIEIHRDARQRFGFPFVRQYQTMLIEPHVYLDRLLQDFYIAGGKVVVREFRSREQLARLRETVIFNCSGLGARALFNDQELIPVRGQLEILLPQPEIDYCYLSSGYMFPRHDGIVLGGTWDHDDWSLTPDPVQADEILETHANIARAMRG